MIAASLMSRSARLTLGFLVASVLTGLAATVWVGVGAAVPGGRSLEPGRVVVVAGAAAGATALHLFLRFVRWQYLLRRIGVRVGAVPVLLSWLGSIAFVPIPFYVGQAVARHRLLPEAERPPPAPVVAAFVWERLFDAWALAVLAGWVLPPAARLVVWGAALAFLVAPLRLALLRALLGAIGRATRLVLTTPIEFVTTPWRAVSRPTELTVTAGASLFAWAIVALPAALLPWMLDVGTPSAAWSSAAAASMLAGAPLPYGIAAAGFAFIDRLVALGASHDAAVLATFVFRVSTTWLGVGVGVVALAYGHARRRRPHAPDHFDGIDALYDAWLPPHYRAHVLERKLAPMRPLLASLGDSPRGLDVGCGRGWYMAPLCEEGARVVGLDQSRRQVEAARASIGADARVVQGSAESIPFADASFDFAYTVNVLHHVGDPSAQGRALAEMARVVRPGGLFFLHEMNARNTLFRWYYSYLFPVLKGIDEGVEWFIDPRRIPPSPTLELLHVSHFTFVPDVTPPALLPLLQRAEARLEASPLAPYSAHFLAVFRRTDAAAGTSGVGTGDPGERKGAPGEGTGASGEGARAGRASPAKA